jgi:class 3 adenylate cyclase/pimeloyl-ACP methyl ester carboxylesterase
MEAHERAGVGPRIQYAKTSDGVNVAYWSIGEGPALISVGDAPWSHIRLEWHIPELRSWYEHLARGRTLIRYDQRGGGLSDRHVEEFSLDAFTLDLDAVVDRLGHKKVALLGIVDSGPVAIAYAARNPDRVSHLILWCSYAKGREYSDLAQMSAVRALMDRDWTLYTETLAHATLGWAAGEPVRRSAELMREGWTPDTLNAIYAAVREYDVTSYLPRLSVPSLVIHRRGVDWFPEDAARYLASHIPAARLVILDGSSLVPCLSDWHSALEVIEDFLEEGDASQGGANPPLASGTAIILFADIVDSTALTERLGDAAFREKARDLGSSVRVQIKELGGTPIEGPTLGDGILATFSSARQAIEGALACARAGDKAGLPLHLGVHAGDVSREKDPDGRDNVYGGAVNIASRISGLSAPGEVLVSDIVRGLARTSAGVAFEDRGEQALKGVGEPVRVWAVVQERVTGSKEQG